MVALEEPGNNLQDSMMSGLIPFCFLVNVWDAWAMFMLFNANHEWWFNARVKNFEFKTNTFLLKWKIGDVQGQKHANILDFFLTLWIEKLADGK